MDERPAAENYAQEFKETAPKMLKSNFALAKAEIKSMVKNLALGTGSFGVIGVLALKLFGLVEMIIICLFSMIFHYQVGLGLLTSVCIGFSLAAVVLALLILVLFLIGVNQFKKVKAPQQTIAETKKTFEVLTASISKGRETAKEVVATNKAIREEEKRIKKESGKRNPISRFVLGTRKDPSQ